MFTHDELDALFGAVTRDGSSKFYPPYNTYNEGESTFIELAVTGFSKDELKAYFDDEGLFVVEGTKEKKSSDTKREYFERNLSTKSFTRKFRTPKNTELVKIEAKDGLLTIEFKRVRPEVKYLDIL